MKLGLWGRPASRTSVTVQLAPTQNKHPTSAEMWVNCPIPHRINHNLLQPFTHHFSRGSKWNSERNKENLSFKQNGAKLKLTTWLHLLFSARSCTATCHVLETTQVGFSEFQVGYLRMQFAALSLVWIAGNSIKIRGQKCIRVTVIMPIIIIL